MAQTNNDYAKALIDLAVENNALNDYWASLSEIKNAVENSPEYLELLACPALTLSERIAVIDEAFGSFPEHVVSFLKLLCENGKIKTLVDCINDFELLKTEMQNTAVATVYFADVLSDEQMLALKLKLEAKYKKNVVLDYVQDKSLIGGIKVEIEGEILDSSVKKHLSQVKEVIGK